MRKQESFGICRPAHPGEPPPAMRVESLVVLGAGALLFSCFGSAYAVPVFFPAVSQALAIPLPHLTALFSATGTLYLGLGWRAVRSPTGLERVSLLRSAVPCSPVGSLLWAVPTANVPSTSVNADQIAARCRRPPHRPGCIYHQSYRKDSWIPSIVPHTGHAFTPGYDIATIAD
jgi:hypothetical protein